MTNGEGIRIDFDGNINFIPRGEDTCGTSYRGLLQEWFAEDPEALSWLASASDAEVIGYIDELQAGNHDSGGDVDTNAIYGDEIPKDSRSPFERCDQEYTGLDYLYGNQLPLVVRPYGNIPSDPMYWAE